MSPRNAPTPADASPKGKRFISSLAGSEEEIRACQGCATTSLPANSARRSMAATPAWTRTASTTTAST